MVRVSIDQKLNPPFAQALLEYPDTEPNVQIDPEDQAALTYTSVTTGNPRVSLPPIPIFMPSGWRPV